MIFQQQRAESTYKIVLFFDITTDSGATYYIDDFALYTDGGGGTPPTAATALPVTFESNETLTGVFEEGDGVTGAPIANPDATGINTSATVYEFTKATGAAWYSGMFNVFASDFDAAAGTTFKVKIWSPKANINVRFQLEKEGNQGPIVTYNVDQTLATADTWVEMTFDFSGTALNLADGYDKIIIFPEFDEAGQPAGDGSIYYIDDIIQEAGSGGGPIAPTAGPTAPTQDAADVISIFSDSYTNVPNAGFNNYGSAAFEQVDLGGNAALKYTFVDVGGGNFQVIELGGDQIDAAAAGMTNFRFDLWFPNEVDASSTFLMKLVDIPGSGATEGSINIGAASTPAMAQGSWLSFDIPITELEANGLGGSSNIQQVVIDLLNSGEVYIDNLYFYKPAGGGGPIAPTAGPTAPTQDAADVISIFSDSYTNVPNAGFNNYGSAAFEQVDLGGNAALKYTFVDVGGGNFQVIELGGDQIDAAAAGMTNFRFDLWFPNEVDASSTFLMKLVDIPGSGATEGSINIGAASTPAMAQGSWLSFDIPITELEANGLGGSSNIQQVVIDLMNSGEVYIDNLYFYKPGAGGGNLAANGDFETGDDTGWLLFQNGGTAALDNSINNGGSWSGRLATGGPSNPAFKQERIGAGTVSAGDVVQVQFDHIGSVVQPGAVFNVLLFGEGAAGASFTHVFNPAPTLSGSWTTFTATFTIPGGTDVSEGISFLIEAVCGGDPGCSVTANIDNVSVTLNP